MEKPIHGDDQRAKPLPLPNAATEEVIRSLWNGLSFEKPIDPGMTLKAEAKDAPAFGAGSPAGADGELAATMLDPELHGADLTIPYPGDGNAAGAPNPDLEVTLQEDSQNASADDPGAAQTSAAQVSSQSATGSSIFCYKENGTVVLRRSQMTGLAEESETEALRLDPDRASDFVIKDKLGVGGMGVVYVARQMSMNRDVAIKMIHPKAKNKAGMANRLIAEALITGDLEHPGIVPVHELGHSDEALFYAMKVVRGVSWSKALREKSERENLDILLRVADAVAFAHSRGIIHRDIKPENVMLGDFGEVLLMDWGLAVSLDPKSKAETISPNNAKAGTAAYMAPEMALGQADKVGYASDVYLLGATLFEILTGRRPHFGPNIFVCLAGAAENIIRDSKRDDKLLDVAMKAMATEPGDRYASVKDFQEALREVIHNQESVNLSRGAGETLRTAVRDKDYDAFSQAIFAFRESRRLWEENGEAIAGEADARREYARCALAKGDYDLAASCLAKLEDPESLALADRVARLKKNDALRKRALITLAIGLVVLGTVAGLLINWQNRKQNEALRLAQEMEEEAHQAVETRRQFATVTAFARNQDFIKAQYHEMDLVGMLAEMRQMSLLLADGGFGDDLPDEIGTRIAALRKEARELAQAQNWRFDAETAARRREESARKHGIAETREIRFGGGVGALAVFALIPEGEYVMGRLEDYRAAGDDDEYPHLVKLTQPFYLGATEVTRGVWRAVVGTEDHDDLRQFFYSDAFAGNTDAEQFQADEWGKWGWRTLPLSPDDISLPATGVSWNDIANKFLPAAQALAPEGWELSLPTEAQWEYACRAGNPHAYANGDDPAALAEIAWTRDSGDGTLQTVALLKANAWGLYDMHGNASELVFDGYSASYYLESPHEDPVCADNDNFPIFRGGGYRTESAASTSSYRDYLYWDARAADTGFRLALVPAGTGPAERVQRTRSVTPEF